MLPVIDRPVAETRPEHAGLAPATSDQLATPLHWLHTASRATDAGSEASSSRTASSARDGVVQCCHEAVLAPRSSLKRSPSMQSRAS